MPTALPVRSAPVRRLSWLKVVELLILVARVRILDVRLHVLADRGADFHDDRLLRLARRWLAVHETIGALLPGLPEPEPVRQVRAILRSPGRATAPTDRTR